MGGVMQFFDFIFHSVIIKKINFMALLKDKIKHFKNKLEEEKKELENELSRIGKKNPDVSGDWEVVQEDLSLETADSGEVSGAFEDMENRVAVEDTLEERFMLVNTALEKIKNNTYGVCSNKEKKAHPIETARLEANPAATECMEHAGL